MKHAELKAAVRHGGTGVDRKVQQRDLKLVPVHEDRPQAVRGVQHAADMVADGMPQQVLCIVQHPGRRQRGRTQLLLACEGQQLADQLGRPRRRLLAMADDAQDVRGVRPAADQGVAADNGGQHVVEVVRDASRELAQRLQLARLQQLGLCLLAPAHLGGKLLCCVGQGTGALGHQRLQLRGGPCGGLPRRDDLRYVGAGAEPAQDFPARAAQRLRPG